ncbi:MAG: ABC transporter ATP-binding protein [Dysgonomonas sp.]
MSDIAIKFENISKQYRLGLIGTGTILHDINRWWYTARGKEDPYLKIGEVNDRASKGNSKYVWALKDITFDVKQGEVIGIIGKNGAGKSTLLKILSRVTSPTTGSIKAKGRIASLLEVGTGFHPELTGRENIFMNGSIMGMNKAEIKSKMDEIVNFAGVERYIDTPVKRYSSGMTVRLGFAIAAHLEPEILVVDEVLAVGDAEFQKKAIGKMKDVSTSEGRTVLFVSHNMGAVKSLCQTGILLEDGAIKYQGEVSKVIDEYFLGEMEDGDGKRSKIPYNTKGYFTEWSNYQNENIYYSGDEINLQFKFKAKEILNNTELGLVIRNSNGEIIFGCNSRDNGGDYFSINEGEHVFNFNFVLPIKGGPYEIDITLVSHNQIIDQWVSNTYLTVLEKFESVLPDIWTGIVRAKSVFSIK